jgi:SAM-dependent methyltransferase
MVKSLRDGITREVVGGAAPQALPTCQIRGSKDNTMPMPETDKIFAGSVPKLYNDYMVPLIFEPYAVDLTSRLVSRRLSHVLEIAAGTGVVTRKLAAALPTSVSIVATDLNQAMLDLASSVGTARPLEWRQADAMQLPFDDAVFDAVVCQFGVMFFPDKAKAFSEARRVLKPGGVFLFNAWDRIEENEFPHTVSKALANFFPADPPRFMARTPHGVSRRGCDRRRSATRRIRNAAANHDRSGAQPGRISPHSGHRVLPGNAAT